VSNLTPANILIPYLTPRHVRRHFMAAPLWRCQAWTYILAWFKESLTTGPVAGPGRFWTGEG